MRERALAIVERAHRGAVEQQHAHVLWLVRALHAQVEMGVLLRGAAAVYALRDQRPLDLTLGGEALADLPDYGAAIGQLVAAGVEVAVSAPCLRRLGAASRQLAPGLRVVEEGEMVLLCAAHDRVWYL